MLLACYCLKKYHQIDYQQQKKQYWCTGNWYYVLKNDDAVYKYSIIYHLFFTISYISVCSDALCTFEIP